MLLTPRTDQFITFGHLAGGDTRRALAVTPINLVVQLALLPVLGWLFIGCTFLEIFAVERVAAVFAAVIIAPLLMAAYLTERAVERRPRRAAFIDRLAWLPVPLLGVVVFQSRPPTCILSLRPGRCSAAWPACSRCTWSSLR